MKLAAYEIKKKSYNISDIIILLLVAISYILFDWIYGLFSFSEYIASAIILIMIITKKVNVSIYNIYIYISTLSLIVLNIILNYYLNDHFNIRSGIAGLFKVSIFLFFCLIVYKFIEKNRGQHLLLAFLNLLSIVVILIGMYILISVETGVFPFSFFWRFTRTDVTSYIFYGTLRMRSIFAEPAHLGYFLNMILAINLTSNYKYRVPSYFNVLITIGLLFTLSYSTLLITLAIYSLVILGKVKDNKTVIMNMKSLIVMLIFIGLIIYFWDYFSHTIIDRTFTILSGDDNSAITRLLGAWDYVNRENLLLGNGIGNTPPIANNYAYMISEFGIFGFLLAIVLSIVLLKLNFSFGIVVVLLNFQKGGYLSASFWVLILSILVFTDIATYINNAAIKLKIIDNN